MRSKRALSVFALAIAAVMLAPSVRAANWDVGWGDGLTVVSGAICTPAIASWDMDSNMEVDYLDWAYWYYNYSYADARIAESSAVDHSFNLSIQWSVAPPLKSEVWFNVTTYGDTSGSGQLNLAKQLDYPFTFVVKWYATVSCDGWDMEEHVISFTFP